MGLFSKKKSNKAGGASSYGLTDAENKKIRKINEDFLCENLSFAAKEAYKRFRTNVVFSFTDEGKCRTIGITSSQPSEGKTITAINLAFSLSELDKKVLIVDADMRKPTIQAKLGIKLTPGLSNLMVTTSDVKTTIHTYSCNSGISFDVLPAGDCPPNPSELLNSDRMSQLFNSLRTIYDYIIVDLPPICVVVDALSVSSNLDGIIVLFREHYTSKKAISYCIEQLRFSDVKILGFVVNGSVEGAGKKYGYSYGNKKYGYSYKY